MQDGAGLGDDGGAGARGRWYRLDSRKTGVIATLLLHALLVPILALVTLEFRVGGGGRGEAEGPIEFAVITSAELASGADESVSLSSPAAPELDEPSLERPELTADVSSTATLDDLTERSIEAPIDAGGGDLASLSEGLDGLGGGSGVGASFFGLEASGSRFAYIVDRSSSMQEMNRMARTQEELVRSIGGLPDSAQFVVVLYSDWAEPLTRPLRWSETSERGEREAARAIGKIETGGGTNPLPGFEMVFSMPTKPDAIYFMTDGRFPDDVPERVASLNAVYRVPVHCVLFGDVASSVQLRDEVVALMQRIASESKGQFTQIPDRAGGR